LKAFAVASKVNEITMRYWFVVQHALRLFSAACDQAAKQRSPRNDPEVDQEPGGVFCKQLRFGLCISPSCALSSQFFGDE